MDYTQPPAIVEPYRIGHSLEEQLFLTHNTLNLKQNTEVIRDLERELKNSNKLPCFMHDNVCYQFRMRADRTLAAVFIYNTGVEKLNFNEEPTQLTQIVYIKKTGNPIIINYKPATSTREEFWNRYWRNPNNVFGDIIDGDEDIASKMKKLFEKYLQQIFEKPKEKLRKPNPYKAPSIRTGIQVNFFMPFAPNPRYFVPQKRPASK